MSQKSSKASMSNDCRSVMNSSDKKQLNKKSSSKEGSLDFIQQFNAIVMPASYNLNSILPIEVSLSNS